MAKKNIIYDFLEEKEIPKKEDFEKKNKKISIKKEKEDFAKQSPKKESKQNQKKKKINIRVLITSLIIIALVALIGSQFTSMSVNSQWYSSIKPSITPPDIVFPIVWSILFLLIAISLYLAWTRAENKKQKSEIILAFGINLLLNILWSVFYFGMRNPFLALLEMIFLIVSIRIMMKVTYKISKPASYLLWPYLLWVLFAAILNYMSIF